MVEGYGAKPHKSVRCKIRVARMDKLKKEQKMPSEPPGARIGHLHVKQIGTKNVNREEEKQAEHVGHFTGEVEDEYSYFLDTLKEEAAFGEEVGKRRDSCHPRQKGSRGHCGC